MSFWGGWGVGKLGGGGEHRSRKQRGVGFYQECVEPRRPLGCRVDVAISSATPLFRARSPPNLQSSTPPTQCFDFGFTTPIFEPHAPSRRLLPPLLSPHNPYMPPPPSPQ